MKNIFTVVISKQAERDIQKVPLYMQLKLQRWIDSITYDGLIVTSKIPAYHDEQLKGKRLGQRSIRLNKSYRAIYTILADDTIEFIEILEINKHEY
ncbi:MAG TPA: type II toxin-antitoxin system mRNA interferase toxin, RelE/StbE family [Aquella sp.]|nr:type II toxin-antitoxin system mRNA interferase toxin, RelE/StbE family [Aquella sp.]